MNRNPKQRYVLLLSVLLFSGILLLAADPGWKNKPMASWTAKDARLILTDSPWAKMAQAGIGRKQSATERRMGGGMGHESGIGYEGLDDDYVRPKLTAILIGGEPSASEGAQSLSVQVRWESAAAIRAAEQKSKIVKATPLEGQGYSIAVEGIPGKFRGDPKKMGEPLKKLAVLKREGKKDVRAVSARVFQREGGVVIVYLFPLSAAIGKDDGSIEFDAEIGRIGVVHHFDAAAMEFQGKLEL